MRRAWAVVVVVGACGGEVDPALLAPQRPWMRLTLSTEVPDGTPTELEARTAAFDLSSTFAFDHLCTFDGGLGLEARADAAPALELALRSWPAVGSRWGLDCLAGECPTEGVRLRWDADGGRYDARPATAGDGLPAGTSCTASFVADAVDPGWGVLEGACENLQGSFEKDGALRFGPVTASFRALCPRPTP